MGPLNAVLLFIKMLGVRVQVRDFALNLLGYTERPAEVDPIKLGLYNTSYVKYRLFQEHCIGWFFEYEEYLALVHNIRLIFYSKGWYSLRTRFYLELLKF